MTRENPVYIIFQDYNYWFIFWWFLLLFLTGLLRLVVCNWIVVVLSGCKRMYLQTVTLFLKFV